MAFTGNHRMRKTPSSQLKTKSTAIEGLTAVKWPGESA